MKTTYIQWLLVAFSNTFNFILYLFYEDYIYPVATSSLLKHLILFFIYFMRTTYIQWLLVAFSNTFNFILYLFYEDCIYPVATSSLLKHF